VALARQGDVPIAQLSKDLGVAESGLRRWMRQADLDDGRRNDGLSSDARQELADLRRRDRVLEMETRSSSVPAAISPRENVLPK
jgi:transposase-like protein